MTVGLPSTRKLIAAILKGDRPEEALARSAQAEVEVFVADAVELGGPKDEQPVHAELRVTAAEAVAALAPLFLVMETLLVELREKTGGKIVVSPAAANAFILAHHVLKKSRHEVVNNRKVDPVHFIPIVRVP
jgi:hypothetical protein